MLLITILAIVTLSLALHLRVEFSKVTTFVLYKRAQLEHKLEAVLHDMVLLLFLKFKKVGADRIKLIHLVYDASLLNLPFNHFDFLS